LFALKKRLEHFCNGNCILVEQSASIFCVLVHYLTGWNNFLTSKWDEMRSRRVWMRSSPVVDGI
jgi:hypothetical protein